VQSAFRSLTRSAGELFGAAASARIEIRSPISFATLWLAPRLPGLARALPRLALDVTTIHQPGDYDALRSGLDIRFGAGRFHGQSSVRLTREALVPVASPSLAAASTDTDWRHLPLLAVAGAREMWAAWFEAAGLPQRRPASYRFDSFVAAMEAARSGAGVLLGSRPLIDRALAAGELVPLSAFELRGEGGHFLTYPAREAPGAAVLALLNWFQSEAERDWANTAGLVSQTITESSIAR
jgi:DNA-binding transcriptional LysR family regulator